MGLYISKLFITNADEEHLNIEVLTNAVAGSTQSETTEEETSNINIQPNNTVDEPRYSKVYGVYIDSSGKEVSIVTEDGGVTWRTHQPVETIEVEQRAAVDDKNPITRLHEYCVGHKLRKPEFISVTSATPVSNSNRHREKCSVIVNSTRISAEGVASSKKVARKIAAQTLYEIITCSEGSERHLQNGSITAEVEGTIGLISSTDGNVEVHPSLEVTDAIMSIESQTAKDNLNQPENTDGSQAISGPGVAIGQTTHSDPINKLHYFCWNRNWYRPQYEYSVIATPNSKSSKFRHTAKCLVHADNLLYRAEGVASRKIAARRIAAKAIFEVIIRAEGYEQHLQNGTVSVYAAPSQLSSESTSVDVNTENVEEH